MPVKQTINLWCIMYQLSSWTVPFCATARAHHPCEPRRNTCREEARQLSTRHGLVGRAAAHLPDPCSTHQRGKDKLSKVHVRSVLVLQAPAFPARPEWATLCAASALDDKADLGIFEEEAVGTPHKVRAFSWVETDWVSGDLGKGGHLKLFPHVVFKPGSNLVKSRRLLDR